MSKSLGNSIFAADFLAQARPLVVRYYLGSAHYRSTIDYHDGALVEAAAALERIEVFLQRATRRLDGAGVLSGVQAVPEAFASAMDDDLAVPQALGILHERIRVGNAALDADDLDTVVAVQAEVIAMTDVLGINPLVAPWNTAATDAAAPALSGLVAQRIRDRNSARAAKDFALADRIRDELAEAGVQLEDTPTETHWSLA